LPSNTNEIEEAYKYLKQNPKEAYHQVLKEKKGAELISLLIAISQGSSKDEITTKLKPLVTQEELTGFESQIATIVNNLNNSKALRPGDALHIMAGAAAGCLAASIVAAISAAALAGYAKEALIDAGIRQTQFDQVDIWWTVFGGGIAAVFGVVLTAVITDPFADKEIVENELSKNTTTSIIEKKSALGSVNYYARNTQEVFLLNMDPLDSGEVLKSYTWYNDYFLFYITNSARFAGTTRLALYAISTSTVSEVLDEKTLNIKYYYFADNQLFYVDIQDTTHSINL